MSQKQTCKYHTLKNLPHPDKQLSQSTTSKRNFRIIYKAYNPEVHDNYTLNKEMKQKLQSMQRNSSQPDFSLSGRSNYQISSLKPLPQNEKPVEAAPSKEEAVENPKQEVKAQAPIPQSTDISNSGANAPAKPVHTQQPIEQVPADWETSDENKKRFADLLAKNFDYLKHLKGDCICGRCICGQCKCPRFNVLFDKKGSKQTIYKKDFQRNPIQQNLPKITMNYFTQTQAFNSPVDLVTTHQSDYREMPLEKQKNLSILADNQFIVPYDFTTKSTYNNNFINWGYYSAKNLKPKPVETVVPNLQFIGNTIYKDSYKKGDPKFNDINQQLSSMIKNQRKRSNIKFGDFPLFLTTNKLNYQPFKTMVKPKLPENFDYRPSPVYDGQFDTTTKKDFQPLNKQKCPSRLELNKLYREYIETLNKHCSSRQ